MRKELKAHLALLTVALLYGGNYTIAKEVMGPGHISPLGLTAIRIISGCVFFTIIHFLFVKEKIQKKDWIIVGACALLGVVLNQSFFLIGLSYTKPINASLIVAMTPIMVLIFAFLILKERLTLRKAMGMAIGFTGTAILISQGEQVELLGKQSFGDIMILINTASFGLFLVLSRTLMKRYNPFTVVRWIFTIGTFFFLPFTYQHLTDISWGDFTAITWFSLSYVVIGATFGTYLLNLYGVKKLGPTMVSVYIYVQPFAASMIAISMSKDQLSVLKVFCGLLIFLGVYFVTNTPQKRPSKQ